jgi:hypothetical protein
VGAADYLRFFFFHVDIYLCVCVSSQEGVGFLDFVTGWYMIAIVDVVFRILWVPSPTR